jgi:hypothetical protein
VAFELNDAIGTGFLTDQRGFSSSRFASVRLQTWARLELYPPKLSTWSHDTSGTREVNVDSGETRAVSLADTSRCKVEREQDATSAKVWWSGERGITKEQRLGRLTDYLAKVARTGQTTDRLTMGNLKEYSASDRTWLWGPDPKPRLGESYAMKIDVSGRLAILVFRLPQMLITMSLLSSLSM